MKTCNVDGCNNPVWSKGMCKMHIPKTPIRKVSLKKADKILERKENTIRLHTAMYEWWNSFGSNKKCESCGCLLPKEFSTVNVHHLLPKQKYKNVEFKSKYWSLLCFTCHNQWETYPNNEYIQKKTKEALEDYHRNS